MGIPIFFRYISEKYPKIITVAIENEGESISEPNPNGNEFDNL